MTSAAVARRGWVEDHLRARYFTRRGPLRFGAEMELLAFDAVTGAVASIVAPAAGGPSTLAAVRAVGERCGWREGPTSKGVPRFAAPSGGALTFEPGGQLEYASAAHASVDGVLNELCAVHGALVAACDIEGVTLRSIGIDAEHGASEAPLQITTERYRRMDAYFAPIGPAGARMMRQTASFQLCIGGVDIAAGWKAANAIAPWLVAIFANSRRYAGRDTGCASYRAETWRSVDRSRTGLVIGDDPVAAYAEFAVAAPAFLAAPEDAAPLSFGDLAAAHATPDALDVHLSTLFPEVRPRGYLELRSMDAVDVGEQAAAMAFAAGLLATDAMARMALEVAGEPSHELLGAAGRSGLNDERLRTRAFALVELALEGCSHLAPAVVSAATLDRARDSFRLLLHERRQAGAMRDQMVPSRSRAIGLGDDAAPSPFASPER